MVVMGLCKGRHVMPEEVKDYIFDNEVNPIDFKGMDNHVYEILSEKLGAHLSEQTKGLQQEDYMDVKGWTGESLTLYVTGLTAAAMSVVGFCARFGCDLVLKHYDRESVEYKSQIMWRY